jgi:Asp-tRNA(Asn)/Glu-tRNA(Gln) amidotransferase B subunit
VKFLTPSLAVISLTFSIYACGSDAETTPISEVVEVADKAAVKEPVAPLAPSGDLTAKQLEDIKEIHETFSEVYPISLEETIKNFKDNQDSGREIEIWLKMVETYKGLIKNGQYSSLEQRQEVFSVILASTMMPLATIKDKVNFQELDDREVDKIYAQFMGSFSPN